MIHTYQIIDGFETLIGPETIHIPMFIALVGFMGFPEEDFEHTLQSKNLWWAAAFYHFFASTHHLSKRHPSMWSHPVLQNIAVGLIILQCFVTVKAMTIVFHTNLSESVGEEFTEERRKWQFWAFLELFCVASIIASAVLFNLIRFFTPGKIYHYYLGIALRTRTTAEQISQLWNEKKLEMPEDATDNFKEKKLQAENTDYMFAQKNVLLFWITFITPSVICYTMEWLYEGRILHEGVFKVTHVHEVITGVQTVFMIYVTFVPFYSYRF